MLQMPDAAVANSSSAATGDSGHITDHWLFHGHTAQACVKTQKATNGKL